MHEYDPPRLRKAALVLIDADQDPDQVVARWADGPALLPAGHCWEAVQVPAPLGRAVLAVGRTVGMGVESGSWPVVCTPGEDSIVFLVPPGTAAKWAVPGTVCLSHGQVAVQAPTSENAYTGGQPVADADTPCTRSAPHWIQPPHLNRAGELMLTDPALLGPALDHIVKVKGSGTPHQVSLADRERSGGAR